MKANHLYIALMAIALVAGTVVFDFLPRPTFSPLERRELAQRPAFTWKKLLGGHYTEELGHWFSDTQPFRDELMAASMVIKDVCALSLDGENIKLHGAAPVAMATDDEEEPEDSVAKPYHNDVTADEIAKMADAGVIVVGDGDHVRALMAYGGSAKSGRSFARMCRRFQQSLAPMGVQVYAMPVPLASEFYTPDKALGFTRPQRPVIDYIFANVGDTVKVVDAYQALAEHANEDIYLRTDHHWAHLGAYYAAAQFARVAGVPFRGLDHYDRHVIHRFVGTMYGYSKDIAVKNAPEDFVYYTPRDVTYDTWFTPYSVDREMHVVGVGRRAKGSYFSRFKDGSGMAYFTYMGGDMKITEVHTSTPGRRHLLIIKDSYGNAIPSFLFGSFSEVHVVDFRYCHRNLTRYVGEHGITDLLFCFNTFNVSSSHVAHRCLALLTQKDGSVHHVPDSLQQCRTEDVDSMPAVKAPAQGEISPEATPTGEDLSTDSLGENPSM